MSYSVHFLCFFFFKQKTAYEMRISDWSSYVCSSDLNSSRRWAVDEASCSGSESGMVVMGQVLGALGPGTLPGLHGRPSDRLTGGRTLVGDRKIVGQGKGVSVRLGLGGRRNSKKTTIAIV